MASNGFDGVRSPDIGIETKARDSQEELTVSIESFCESERLSAEDVQKAVDVRTRLECILKDSVDDRLNLLLFGSFVCGFATKESEIDMTVNSTRQQNMHMNSSVAKLMLAVSEPRHRYAYGKVIDNEILDKIYKIIRAPSMNFSDLELVEHTFMPLLVGVDDVTGNNWQITISNENGVKSARLLKMYSKVDSRLVPLVLVVKRWARTQGINNARKQTPNNYCWTLLMIYYLMAECSPAVLPCLHKTFTSGVSQIRESDDTEAEVEIPSFSSTNDQSLGELLQGFFAFYAVQMKRRQVFSVREGRCLSPTSVRHRRPTRQWQCRLLVEDPFSLNNIPKSVFEDDIFANVVDKLRSANTLLKSGGTLHDLLKGHK